MQLKQQGVGHSRGNPTAGRCSQTASAPKPVQFRPATLKEMTAVWCKNRGKLPGMYRIIYKAPTFAPRAQCMRCHRHFKLHPVCGLPRHHDTRRGKETLEQIEQEAWSAAQALARTNIAFNCFECGKHRKLNALDAANGRTVCYDCEPLIPDCEVGL